MADTAAIVNLMQHAADRLAEEDAQDCVTVSAGMECRQAAVSVGLAMAYAEAILRAVAATLTESLDDSLDDAARDVVDAARAWREVEESDDRDAIRRAEYHLGLAVDAFDGREAGRGA